MLSIFGQIFRLIALICALSLSSVVFAFGDPAIGKVPGPISTMENLDGSPIDLSKYRGSTLILYFGADWCGPCVISSRPAMLAALNKYRDHGLKVLYMNLDGNDTRTKKIEEAKALGLDIAMTSLAICPSETCRLAPRLSTGRLGEFGKIYVIPTLLIIDREGFLRALLENAHVIRRNLNEEVERVIAENRSPK